MVAPPHPRAPLENIDHALEVTVVMGAGLRVGGDLDRARPDLLSPDSGKIDRGGAVHARGLGRIRVELVTRDHLDAVGLPIDRLVLAFVAHSIALICKSNGFALQRKPPAPRSPGTGCSCAMRGQSSVRRVVDSLAAALRS